MSTPPQAGNGRDDQVVVVAEGYDPSVRWRPGERLEQLFEQRCDWLAAQGRGDELAVDAGQVRLTFAQLDRRANQLARHLLASGTRPGDRVGLLVDDPVHAYVGMLAVLKSHAAYVPLDPSFPPERVATIATDAAMARLLSLSHLHDRLGQAPVPLVCLDEIAAQLAHTDDRRLTAAETGGPAGQLCYLIYTSGSTGRPKGVAIEHPSICNFVRVAVEVYGLGAHDRVYQGMTIAFDFSVEEIWVPLLAGATLVPKPPGSSLLGPELQQFLRAKRVSALCCVPTLLATLDPDLPDLRFLLVSGEACPQELVTRWHRPGRRFLNVYGPTEATVTATWTVLDPARPVTIGVPLPTYTIVILDPDPDQARALPRGEVGEIGIAGIGLASGYVNRPDLTQRSFIPDFLGIAGNPSGRIYRTGDLGRVNPHGQLEHHGRIDTQVKVRGYRIELTEIESVLLQAPQVAQAVVGTFEPEPGVVELVAYYTPHPGATIDQEALYQHLRQRLPAYMVPAYLQQLKSIPMLASDKADRTHLPPPHGPRRLASSSSHYAAPATPTQHALADALAQVLRLERVGADHHFFDDLGANSLLLARFCARVRQHHGLPPVAMQDVYQHPTINRLATHLDTTTTTGADTAPAPTAKETVTRAPTSHYLLCGTLQILAFLGAIYLGAVAMTESYEWISAADGLADVYVRSLATAGGAFLALSTAPVLAKWMLVGRWKRREIPVWSLGYFRFWIVKTLIRTSPFVLFVGSPLYVLYLRALGAKVGRGVTIFTRNLPVCTDLLTIGDGTVIRKDSSFTCYRAHAGQIQTGPVTLGKDVLVGEATVIDIDTSMGDGAQLGHSSCLHATQAVPAGQRWHGSPAEPTDVDYRTVDPAACGTLRRAFYGVQQLLVVLVVSGLGIELVAELLPRYRPFRQLLDPGPVSFTSLTFHRDALASSFVLFFGGLLIGLALVFTVPRLLSLALTPGRVYPLYGIHYWVQRTIARVTNVGFHKYLFGDSSYIVHYLRGLGYDLSRVEQTGTNFGVEVKHETPYLSFVGSGTMVSDGLSIINAEFSSTSFRVARTAVGQRNFLGNNIFYPSGARTGENCLLGTKTMVPIYGDVREGVGLLGSPPFEIPRSVQRDSTFDNLRRDGELPLRLAAKNRHNTLTMSAYLLVQWLHFFGVLLVGLIAADLHDPAGAPVIAAATVLILAFSIVYFALVERAATAFRRLRPRFCSIYDRDFWRHERFWKLCVPPYIEAVLNGTPLKNATWRMLGVRLGRRVFDDGCAMPERTLVTVGDDCVLNERSTIQCHSLEDGAFKCDRITVGTGCTIGVNAFVHYGVTIGDGAVLDADSFLMKGEEIAPHARWRGNPASGARDAPSARPARPAVSVSAAPAPNVPGRAHR
jgi:non-ribosomal peptide synthetase-like protein